MSRRRFVREIKAKEVKNLNPSDIIYLAMKDGSIILIADDDEETINYDELKIDTKYKRGQRYYNKNTDLINDSSLYTLENENNYKTNTLTYNNADNISNISTINSKMNQVKNNSRALTKIEKPKNKENERNNKTINYKNLNYEVKNERLDKSFDDIQEGRKNNLGYHEIEYLNKQDKSFVSNKYDSISYDRTKRNKNYLINNNYNNENNRRNHNTITYDNKARYSPNLINISNISYGSNTNTTLNRNHYMKKEKSNDYLFKKPKNEYNYETNNYNNRGNQIRSRSSANINKTPERNYYVKRKEIEIMGRIVNDENSYKNIDHNHPNTLFDHNCVFCQKLARDNKISISNIKVESIYDNYSFLATFGGSGKKEGKRKIDFDISGNYYI